MKKHIRKAWGINRSFLVGVIFFSAMLLFSGHNQFIAYGENIHVNVTGKYYEFDEKNDYKFTAADSSVDAIAGKNTFGTFSLSGTGIESGSTDKYPTYFLI